MKAYLATPTYDGRITCHTHRAILQAHTNGIDIFSQTVQSSLLALGFNMLWADALNKRSSGVDRFVMVHADVMPQGERWLESLLAEMDGRNLDVLSAVIPLKDWSGRTSTGWETRSGVRRNYKLVEAMLENTQPVRPVDSILLINTGLMAVRFDKPWVEEFEFTIADEIKKHPDGTYEAMGTSEDWLMSHWLNDHRIPYGYTTQIPVVHIGTGNYLSHPPAEPGS